MPEARTARWVAWYLFGAAVMSAAEPVTGRVCDAMNTPLPGAVVMLRSVNRPAELLVTKTDKDGVYEFREVPDGTYALEASLRGFVSVRYHPLRIRYPFGLEQDFRLPRDEVYESQTPRRSHVFGELRPGGSPLGGVQVCLQQGREEHCVTANRIGQYSLEVKPGKWRALVRNQKVVLWKQDLALDGPGEYRNAIRIRVPEPAAGSSKVEVQPPE